MKHKFALKLLCCLLLAPLIFTGGALAQESEVQQAELQLFTAGCIPQPMRMRTVMPEGFADYVADQMRQQTEKIYLLNYGIPENSLALLLSSVINDNPDLFYIGSKISYTLGMTSGNVHSLIPQYLYTGDDLQARIAAYDASVNEITAYARSVSSDPLGQMLAVNSYFCMHYDYDSTTSKFSADKLFSDGTGVCQAYMLGYAAVLDELGIENTHATSYTMNHTWNLVKLGEDWYHVDVTWNDPQNTTLQAGYKYFMLSDDGMLASDHHSWTAQYVAANTTYDDFFWRSTRTPMAVDADTVYYMDSSLSGAWRRIRSWKIGSAQTTAVHDFSIADASGGYHHISNFDPLCTDGSRLYYAARGGLYSMTPGMEGSALIYSCADDGLYIWSCWMQDGAVQMLVGSENLGSATVVSFPLNTLKQRLSVPLSVIAIGEEAFAAAKAYQIVLPDGLKSIGERAFADCGGLHLVNIPSGVSSIADSAFSGCENLTLLVSAGSYGETYAKAQGIHYLIQ